MIHKNMNWDTVKGLISDSSNHINYTLDKEMIADPMFEFSFCL